MKKSRRYDCRLHHHHKFPTMIPVHKYILAVFFLGITVSRATRFSNNHGHRNAWTTLLDNHNELLSWTLMGTLSSSICVKSTPLLAFVVASITLFGCGVFFERALFGPQQPPISQPADLCPPEEDHSGASFKTANAAECREVIKSGTPPMASKNTLSALEARARPNQRLNLAFGIESCFTSSDEKSCKTFRTQVEKLLYVEESEWISFAATARETAQEALNIQEDATSLFRVVQLVTLKTMMSVLWPDRDPKQSTNEQISTLAHEVNLQWLRSKESNTNDDPSWLFGKQKSLKDAVKAVFPDWNEADSEQNPCNLILPGYETMWRVVLRCFAEIKARNHFQTVPWRAAMRGFSRKPTKQQLEAPMVRYATKVAAVHVAKEALRLYPPTRRIYREYRSDDGRKINVSADIEAMQRKSSIWQDHQDKFVPERWIGLEEGFDEGYMPFGASPFNCPAKRYKNVPMPFGSSMIALLVGILSEATSDWDIDGDFPDLECPLDTDREAYSAAVLRRWYG